MNANNLTRNCVTYTYITMIFIDDLFYEGYITLYKFIFFECPKQTISSPRHFITNSEKSKPEHLLSRNKQ